jgi:hypothetical protein
VVLSAGCATAPSDPRPLILPPLERYSADFQERAAREMEEAGRPCDRLEPTGECSALSRLVIDHLNLRDDLRALHGDALEK